MGLFSFFQKKQTLSQDVKAQYSGHNSPDDIVN